MSDELERVLGVYELAQNIKRIIEARTTGIWVEGEVGRLQSPTSGHLYFNLKDEEKDACLDCVVYRREAIRYGRSLREGARVQLRGRATFYPPRGRLQWVVDAVRPAGQGALLLALQKLKEKLSEEGLFADERKRPLPADPACIGVVTSRTGAVFSDIVQVAARRAAVRIILSSALVQGEGAVTSIIAALDRLERLAELDVIIVARGGGSREDLMVFNDERVVRRIARCRVPVVSAVGHEADVSLCDFVADARAATPSQAAEMVVPDKQARLELLLRLERHLARATWGIIGRASLEISRLSRRLGDPRLLLAERQQFLDELTQRLETSHQQSLTLRRRRLLEVEGRLGRRHPRAVLSTGRAELYPLSGRLRAAVRRRLDGATNELGSNARALSALSPLAILERGYALAFDPSQRPIVDPKNLAAGDLVTVRVSRGAFRARFEEQLDSLTLPNPLQGSELAGASALEDGAAPNEANLGEARVRTAASVEHGESAS